MFDGTTFAEDISTGQSDLLKNLFEDAQAMLEVEVRRPCCRVQLILCSRVSDVAMAEVCRPAACDAAC